MNKKIMFKILGVGIVVAASFFAGILYANKMFSIDEDRIVKKLDTLAESRAKGVPEPKVVISGDALKKAVAPSMVDEMTLYSVDTSNVRLRSINGASFLEIPIGVFEKPVSGSGEVGLIVTKKVGPEEELPARIADIKIGSLAYIHYSSEEKKIENITNITFFEIASEK